LTVFKSSVWTSTMLPWIWKPSDIILMMNEKCWQVSHLNKDSVSSGMEYCNWKASETKQTNGWWELNRCWINSQGGNGESHEGNTRPSSQRNGWKVSSFARHWHQVSVLSRWLSRYCVTASPPTITKSAKVWANYTSLMSMDNNNTKKIWIAECCYYVGLTWTYQDLNLKSFSNVLFSMGMKDFPPIFALLFR